MQVCTLCGNNQNRDTATFCAQCGGMLPSVGPGMGTGRLPPQTILHGRYVIIGLVGKGGMGAVYRVTDLHIPGKVWALKEMSDAALGSPTERAHAVAAFQREAQLLATLDHPNLPQVVDYFTDGGRHYLAMDLIEGETLDALLLRSGPLPEDQVLAWAAQLCDVLGYLHGQPQSVIFRDLKPGNVMVTPHGQLKLIDFGIARLFKPGQQSDTQAIGTRGYSPPEQYGRGQTDARSDLYSLGVMLHEMLTGHDPTQTPFQLPPARQLKPHLSLHVEQALVRATALDPVDRFASAAEMDRALRLPSPSGVLPAPGPASLSSSVPSLHRATVGQTRARAVAAIVTVLCLAGITGMWAMFNTGRATPTPQPTTQVATAATATGTAALVATPGGRTATAAGQASDTPTPTATHTPSPSPSPSRTATASPTPTRTDVEAEAEALIWRYGELKARAMGQWETDELNTVLRRGALSTQLGSVNWLRDNNSHWEYELHSMTFDRFEYPDPTTIRVLVTKVETGRYYHQGSSTPSEIRSYYNHRYEVWYNIEKIGERWYITDIDL